MLVKIVSSKRKKKRREHKSGLSLSPSLRDKMCGSLNGVLCALHLMSSLFFFFALSPFYVRPQSTVLLSLSQELSRFHAHEVHPV